MVAEAEPFTVGDTLTIQLELTPQKPRFGKIEDERVPSEGSVLTFYKNGEKVGQVDGLYEVKYHPAVILYMAARASLVLRDLKHEQEGSSEI